MRVRRGKRPCGSRCEATRQSRVPKRGTHTQLRVTYFVTAIGAPFQKDDDIFGQIWPQRHKDTEKKHGAPHGSVCLQADRVERLCVSVSRWLVQINASA